MIELLNTDCMEYMATLPDKAFDLAIVDPPYGIGIGDNKSGMGRRKGDAHATYKMGEWDHEAPPKAYFDELRRVSVNQIVWGANHFIDRIPYPSSCWLIWDKLYSHEVSFAACELAWTSFESVAKKYTGTPLQPGRIHPTQKPVALYRWILKNYAKPGQRILDTHGGSMSIAIACDIEGFDLTLCEIDKDYFEAGKKRLEQHQAQPRLFDAPTTEQPVQQSLL
jgi:site-specific DNA-methyltransferase (adenine-specific)